LEGLGIAKDIIILVRIPIRQGMPCLHFYRLIALLANGSLLSIMDIFI